MNEKIKINKLILAEETEIGPGAIILLDKATTPIIRLLRIYYENDPESISGDIEYLFSSECDGIVDNERFWPGR